MGRLDAIKEYSLSDTIMSTGIDEKIDSLGSGEKDIKEEIKELQDYIKSLKEEINTGTLSTHLDFGTEGFDVSEEEKIKLIEELEGLEKLLTEAENTAKANVVESAADAAKELKEDIDRDLDKVVMIEILDSIDKKSISELVIYIKSLEKDIGDDELTLEKGDKRIILMEAEAALGKKLIKNPDEIDTLKNTYPIESIKNAIFSYLTEDPFFSKRYKEAYDATSVINSETYIAEDVEGIKRFEVFKIAVNHGNLHISKDVLDDIFRKKLDLSTTEIGDTLGVHLELGEKLSTLEKKYPDHMDRIKKYGVMGAVHDLINSSKMGRGHKGAALLFAEMAAIGGVFYGIFKVIKELKLGFFKGIGALILGEFATSAITGHGAFDLVGRAIYGGLDQVDFSGVTGKTKKLHNSISGNEEKKKELGTSLLTGMLLGEEIKISEIKGYSNIEGGKLVFDVEKFKNKLPEGDWRKDFLDNMIAKVGATKVAKSFSDGLGKIGFNATTYSTMDGNTTIGALFDKMRKPIKKKSTKSGEKKGSTDEQSQISAEKKQELKKTLAGKKVEKKKPIPDSEILLTQELESVSKIARELLIVTPIALLAPNVDLSGSRKAYETAKKELEDIVDGKDKEDIISKAAILEAKLTQYNNLIAQANIDYIATVPVIIPSETSSINITDGDDKIGTVNVIPSRQETIIDTQKESMSMKNMKEKVDEYWTILLSKVEKNNPELATKIENIVVKKGNTYPLLWQYMLYDIDLKKQMETQGVEWITKSVMFMNRDVRYNDGFKELLGEKIEKSNTLTLEIISILFNSDDIDTTLLTEKINSLDELFETTQKDILNGVKRGIPEKDGPNFDSLNKTFQEVFIKHKGRFDNGDSYSVLEFMTDIWKNESFIEGEILNSFRFNLLSDDSKKDKIEDELDELKTDLESKLKEILLGNGDIENIDTFFQGKNFTLSGETFSLPNNIDYGKKIKKWVKEYKEAVDGINPENTINYVLSKLMKKILKETEDDITNKFEGENKKYIDLYYKNQGWWDNITDNYGKYTLTTGVNVGTVLGSAGMANVLAGRLGMGVLGRGAMTTAILTPSGTIANGLMGGQELGDIGGELLNPKNYLHTAVYVGVFEGVGAILKSSKYIQTANKYTMNSTSFGIEVGTMVGLSKAESIVFDGEWTTEEIVNAIIFTGMMRASRYTMGNEKRNWTMKFWKTNDGKITWKLWKYIDAKPYRRDHSNKKTELQDLKKDKIPEQQQLYKELSETEKKKADLVESRKFKERENLFTLHKVLQDSNTRLENNKKHTTDPDTIQFIEESINNNNIKLTEVETGIRNITNQISKNINKIDKNKNVIDRDINKLDANIDNIKLSLERINDIKKIYRETLVYKNLSKKLFVEAKELKDGEKIELGEAIIEKTGDKVYYLTKDGKQIEVKTTSQLTRLLETEIEISVIESLILKDTALFMKFSEKIKTDKGIIVENIDGKTYKIVKRENGDIEVLMKEGKDFIKQNITLEKLVTENESFFVDKYIHGINQLLRVNGMTDNSISQSMKDILSKLPEGIRPSKEKLKNMTYGGVLDLGKMWVKNPTRIKQNLVESIKFSLTGRFLEGKTLKDNFGRMGWTTAMLLLAFNDDGGESVGIGENLVEFALLNYINGFIGLGYVGVEGYNYLTDQTPSTGGR